MEVMEVMEEGLGMEVQVMVAKEEKSYHNRRSKLVNQVNNNSNNNFNLFEDQRCLA